MVNDADNLSEEPRLTNIFSPGWKCKSATLSICPRRGHTSRLTKVVRHVQFIDKNILMISNMFIQDAQRAVSVAKNPPITQAAGPQMRETYLYEADQSATMAGAIMRRMLLVGWDSSYLFLFLVEDNNVIILYIFPIQLLEYQTDVRRCRFDKNLAHCSART